MSIEWTMDECPVRICAYVYRDAESHGDYGHLFNECPARTTKFTAVTVECSSMGQSKSGRRMPDLEIPAPL